jgi:hypothetical protein
MAIATKASRLKRMESRMAWKEEIKAERGKRGGEEQYLIVGSH